MNYQNLNLSDKDSARVVRLAEQLQEEDAKEVEALLTITKHGNKLNKADTKRVATLLRRRKFITKSNLMKIFVLRGLAHMERGLSAEEIIEMMVKQGSARGRPDAR